MLVIISAHITSGGKLWGRLELGQAKRNGRTEY